MDPRPVRPDLLTDREVGSVLGGYLGAARACKAFKDLPTKDVETALKIAHAMTAAPDLTSTSETTSLLAKVRHLTHGESQDPRVASLASMLNGLAQGLRRIASNAAVTRALLWWVEHVDALDFGAHSIPIAEPPPKTPKSN